MKLPPLLANRSIITTFYKTVLDDGSYILINSSLGNEDLVMENKKNIGKNVVAKANIQLYGRSNKPGVSFKTFKFL